jgi:HEPN domain-containing protein
LAHIERFELPDELLDNGHFTIIRAGEGWHMFFNFLSGRAKANDMLELASEFLATALSSKEKGHSGPAVDNLFSASELISKAELILHRSRAVKSKRHGLIASEINAWARLGNIDAAFVALFNKLSRQRPNARYSDKENRPPTPDQESFDLVQAMIDRGLERIGKATDRELTSRVPENPNAAV